MTRYLITPLLFISAILSAGMMPIEKEFESRVHALAIYKESIGADTNSTEHYIYWGKGQKLIKYRFMMAESADSVRLSEDMFFDNNGELVLFTYWSGNRKDLKQLEKGSGPHSISKGKCVFRNEKMIQWYEDESLRANVPSDEWSEQEQYILHSLNGAIDGWKEITQSKKVKK